MRNYIFRFKSPIRSRNEAGENTNNRFRSKKNQSPDSRVNNGDNKDRRKAKKEWTREKDNTRQWERRAEDRRKERLEKTDKDKKNERADKHKLDEPKEETKLQITDNPVFEARRKKFELNMVVEPASKKIRLVKKESPVLEEKVKIERTVIVENAPSVVEEPEVVENNEPPKEDFSGGQAEVDEIDSFLNEDVLDLSAEVWSSDDDLFPKPKISQVTPKVQQVKPSTKVKPVEKKEPISFKGKGELSL